MSRRVETILIDDLDGTTATETVEFSLDGVHYEIDLTQEHATELRELMELFSSAARTVKDRRRTAGASSRRGTTNKTKEIRSWAEANGRHVNSRGRLNADIVEAYEAAHQN